MKIVTLSVACNDDDAERIEAEMMQSQAAQVGLYTFGVEIRDAKKWEENEVNHDLDYAGVPEREVDE